MKNQIAKLAVVMVLLLPGVPVSGSTPQSKKFDEFKDINCEDEMARLDNYALALQVEPNTTGVIIFYGGRTFRGRLPKRGEATLRAGRLIPYLVNRRGIPPERIQVIDGGYAKEWFAELWIVPLGASLPTPRPTVPHTEMRFRKGKSSPRHFGCNI